MNSKLKYMFVSIRCARTPFITFVAKFLTQVPHHQSYQLPEKYLLLPFPIMPLSHPLVLCIIVNINKHCFSSTLCTVYSFLRPRVGYSAAYKSFSSTRYLRKKNSPKFGRFQPGFSRVNTQNIQIVDLNQNGT